MAPTADPASAPVPANKTFKDQDKLPKLPIPDLKDTCNRYLASLQYLQSQDEHDHTKKVVQDFLENEGPQLHAQLQEYASQRDNYVEAFWEGDYLAASDSVVLNLNPFFILEDDPTPSRGNQMMRTASLILASLSFVHDLRTGQLEPDNVRGTPLDMHQYTRLFGTARIPTANGCRLEGYGDESSHIVVLRRGQMYWFEVLDENHRPLFTERALLANLQAIVNDADKLPRSEVALNALGVLTTEKRKAWSDCRERLEGGDSGENNRRCLKVVDSALFVVCMDDWEPPSSNSGSSASSVPENRAGRKGADKGSKTSAYGAELCNNMLCGTYQLEDGVQVGTCTNRWYDKLQIIVCSNGAAGINFEHTGVDGHTVLRFVADIYTELIMRFAKSINSATQSLFKAKTSPYAKGIGGKRPILFETSSKDKKAEEEEEEVVPEYETSPRKLEWDLTPPIRDAIQYGETRLSDLICQNECQVLVFAGYGKSFLTRHRFSPDAFVQMSFQAAYCKLYGRPATTYEPAMVKHFRRGRTEAIRTVQGHSVEFTSTFFEKGVLSSREEDRRKSGSSSSGAKSGGGGPTPEEKIGALRKACEGHTKLTRECSKGMGHDRHLYAMYELWKKMQVQKRDGVAGAAELAPALFRDSGYQTLSATIISTSNCGNPALRLFGFGPVNPAGFGIGYIIKDDEIAICASSKHLQTARFLDTLNSYLEEVGDLIIETYKAANSRVSATFIDHSGRECDVRTGRPLEGDGAKAGGFKKRVTLVEQLGGSNGYDDFERGVHNERPSLASGRAPGGSTMGSAGYGFFDAGGGAGVDKTGGAGGAAGSGVRTRKGQGVMEEILGVGKTVLFSEYS